MLKSRTVFILIVILSILVAAYFVLFETKTESQTIDLNSLEMLSHELTEDGLSLLYFEMPSDYIIRQDLSDSLSFEPVDYYKEGTLLSPSLKKCV